MCACVHFWLVVWATVCVFVIGCTGDCVCMHVISCISDCVRVSRRILVCVSIYACIPVCLNAYVYVYIYLYGMHVNVSTFIRYVCKRIYL